MNYYEANKEKVQTQQAAYYAENKDKRRVSTLAYRNGNRDKLAKKQLEYYKANKDKIVERQLEYQKANPELKAATEAKRRATKLNATPAWLTDKQKAQIVEMYAEAKNRQGDWNVDHIIPLRGKTVRGLHVPWNLQLLSAKDNQSKGNQKP